MLKTIKTAKTVKNNIIELIETQNKSYDKTILIIGVFHGEEPQGEQGDRDKQAIWPS